MPSSRTLRRHLNKVRLHTGVNKTVFHQIKDTVECMTDPQEKAMAMMWDEFSVQPYVYYDKKQDLIVGFEDFGDKRTSKFADHILVFMVRGVKSGTKMPISYYHVNAATKWEQLTKCIKENVRAVSETGLQLILTVCDQGSSNLAAIRKLREQYELQCGKEGVDPGNPVGLEIEGVKVYVVFDPPHVAKSDRNNLLDKDLELEFRSAERDRNVERKFVSWHNYELAYDLDRSSDSMERFLPKLTDEHVRPPLIKKMKVSHSVNVLSESMSSFINLSLLKKATVTTANGSLKLPPEAVHAANYALFRDRLFDSVNGQSLHPEKPLKGVLTEDSIHIKFWDEAKQALSNMRYVNKQTKKPLPNPPCLKAWLTNLDALKKVWEAVKDLGFKHLKLGLLNQDALENFFGCMRSHSGRFVKLNCYQADGVFKTLLINNLVSYHAVGSNCLPDFGKGMFALKNLIAACEVMDVDDIHEGSFENDELRHPPKSTTGRKHCLTFEIKRKLALIFTKEVLSHHCTSECKECLRTFFQQERERSSSYVMINSAMDYFERGFTKATSICFRELSLMCFVRELAYSLKKTLVAKIDFEWVSCKEHRTFIKERFLFMIIIYCISKWCSHLNKLLKGSAVSHGGSLIETCAREHFLTFNARRVGANKQRGYVV